LGRVVDTVYLERFLGHVSLIFETRISLVRMTDQCRHAV